MNEEEAPWRAVIMRLMANAPEKPAEAEAQMPMPRPGRKENPIRLPKVPSARPPKTDRPLTEREKGLYKMFKGTFPHDGMMLSEFRRYMGQVRRRGGFR